MTFPNIPNVTPTINLRRNDVLNLLVASIAFEELGLAHLVNAEAEKLQAALGTLPGVSLTVSTISQLLSVNDNVNSMLKTAIKNEMLLQFKLEDVLAIPTSTTTTTTTTSSTTTTTTSSTSTTTTSSSTSTSSTTTITTTSTTSTTSTTTVPLFTPLEIAQAITSRNTFGCLSSASFNNGAKNVQSAVFTMPLQGFPTDGVSYAVLSSGIASEAPGVATNFVSTGTGGPSNNDNYHDIFDLILTFQLPQNPGLISFNWKFGTEENPTYLGSAYSDHFTATLSTPTLSPTNIALLPNTNPVDVNTAAPYSNMPSGSSETPDPPYPTPNDVSYNAVTIDIMTSSFDLSGHGGETLTVVFEIADRSDSTYDSVVFLDNLRIEGCESQP